MLDDEDGVAEIAETLEDVDEALRVARVQADGGLVQDVERANEMRTQRRGQLDALRFTARERGGKAVKGEVVEADFVEELQAGANLFQDFIGDVGFPGDAHGACFGAQARAAAFGAHGIPAETAQKDAHVEFVLFALEPVEETFYAGEIV